jgi:hypothetical protein
MPLSSPSTSIIVPEFGGIDHLPDSLDGLRTFHPPTPTVPDGFEAPEDSIPPPAPSQITAPQRYALLHSTFVILRTGWSSATFGALPRW